MVILVGLAPASAHAQVLTLTPSLSVGTEYNDNIFLRPNKESDVLGTFSPGLNLALESPTYRLAADYSFTSEVYAQHSELDKALARQQALLAGTYRPSAELTLGLTEAYRRGRSTNTVSLTGVSVGFQESWSNSVSANMGWTVTPRTTLRLNGIWGIQRFEGTTSSVGSRGSDNYLIDAGVDYAFTPRLTGTALYQFGYITFAGTATQGQGDAMTHSPRVGGSYQITETLTATANAGPIFVTDRTDSVAAGGAATITQRLWFGSASLNFDRSVGTAASFGRVTTNTTAGGSLVVDRWIKDLTVALSPRYTTAESTGGRNTGNVDLTAVTVTLSANYRFNRWVGAYASYIFFHQTNGTAGTGSLSGDVDQNRISAGIQVGYPFKFD